MPTLEQDKLFVALTRPQTLFGVPYTFAVINLVIATEAFLVFRNFWALAIALIVHAVGWLLTRENPYFIDVWVTSVRRCPRVPNYSVWKCNSYSP